MGDQIPHQYCDNEIIKLLNKSNRKTNPFAATFNLHLFFGYLTKLHQPHRPHSAETKKHGRWIEYNLKWYGCSLC